MTSCAMEFCRNWSGDGCTCELLELEPDLVDSDVEEDW